MYLCMCVSTCRCVVFHMWAFVMYVCDTKYIQKYINCEDLHVGLWCISLRVFCHAWLSVCVLCHLWVYTRLLCHLWVYTRVLCHRWVCVCMFDVLQRIYHYKWCYLLFLLFIKKYIWHFFFLLLNTKCSMYYPAMTAFTDQYSLPNTFFDIDQL